MNIKTLVAYSSASGVTEKTAKMIAEAAEADLYRIVPAVIYTSDNLDWNNANSRSSIEMNNSGSRPAITGRCENLSEYVIIFVGFPIWWYQAPRIIQTFLESYDFSGKTVIPFATSGSSGMGNTDGILYKSCSGEIVWKPGKRLSSKETLMTVGTWIKSLNL